MSLKIPGLVLSVVIYLISKIIIKYLDEVEFLCWNGHTILLTAVFLFKVSFKSPLF